MPGYKGDPGEINKAASLTIPDRSLTPRQLINNHVRGLNSDVKVYNENYFDTVIPNFADITEKIDWIKQNQQALDDLNEEVKNLKEEAWKKAEEERKKKKQDNDEQVEEVVETKEE